jgi:glycosyltransferase involved in cell wall biosynthesis
LDEGRETMSRSVTWVIPCYNEAARLDAEAFVSAVDSEPGVALLFVDDGSTDVTCERLRELSKRRPAAIRLFSLPRNAGKAEAVRLGLLEALREGASVVGYVDADLATPLDEMGRLTRIIVDRDLDVVIGARVAMLGHRISRNARRHYLGRVFASAASMILRLHVYDTQCGAKLFRRTPALETALAIPFLSRWAFDVELLGRLVSGSNGAPTIEPSRMLEEPLTTWNDVPGSNLHLTDIVTAGLDLVRISGDMNRRRKAR